MKAKAGCRQGPGFTLVEMLVVIAIIGVLAGFLLPSLVSARCRAKQGAIQSMIEDVGTAIAAYNADFGAFPQDCAENQSNPLVTLLQSAGPKNVPYYAFRKTQLVTTATCAMNGGGTAGNLTWVTPLGNDFRVFYQENASAAAAKDIPATAENRFGYDLYSPGCDTRVPDITNFGQVKSHEMINGDRTAVNNWE